MLHAIIFAMVFVGVFTAFAIGYKFGAHDGENKAHLEFQRTLEMFTSENSRQLAENHKLRMEIKKNREEQTYDKYLRSTTKGADQGKEE